MAGLYLYLHPKPRAYYASLRRFEIARLRRTDFLSTAFVPLYAGVAGLTAGGWIGSRCFAYGDRVLWTGGSDSAGYGSLVVLGAVIGGWIAHELAARFVDRNTAAT